MTVRSDSSLNMARRLRPTQFSQLRGQELSIKMLQNSLFSGTFFPVYLFTGQRGCGKTTTGRLFAAALNCEQLPTFQKNPAQAIPCHECASCLMMQNGSHPDFIEIDAASHTGVDDVRTMLEAASYAPLVGRKKIYLIDEAHMLSKAAFNALLKMLEEPPKTALFTLATTELNKVPATVRSRCFQLTFGPLDRTTLKEYLREIATTESFTIDDRALDIIIQESEGSVRDALNLLEQLTLSSKNITEDLALELLGMLPKERFFGLMQPIFETDPAALLTILEKNPLTSANAQGLFGMLVDFLRALIRRKHQVTLTNGIFIDDQEQLDQLAQLCSYERLQAMLQIIWGLEELLLTSHLKHLVIEHMLVQLASQVNIVSLKELVSSLPVDQSTPKTPASSYAKASADRPQQKTESVAPQKTPLPAPTATIHPQTTAPDPGPATAPTPQSPINDGWEGFLREVATAGDPMLASIFRQARVLGNPVEGILPLGLPAKSSFFHEKIAESKNQWHPILVRCYAGCRDISITTLAAEPEQRLSEYKKPVQPMPQSAPQVHRQPAGQLQKQIEGAPEEWPLANSLLKEFSGTIEVVKTTTSS